MGIPSTFGARVVAAFIEDRVRRLVALGTACRPDTEMAAAKALTEAIGMYDAGRDLLDEGGGFWRAVRAGRISHRPYRPYRHDRGYRDDFGDDWHDMNDVRLHLQVYLDPRMRTSGWIGYAIQPPVAISPTGHRRFGGFAAWPSEHCWPADPGRISSAG